MEEDAKRDEHLGQEPSVAARKRSPWSSLYPVRPQRRVPASASLLEIFLATAHDSPTEPFVHYFGGQIDHGTALDHVDALAGRFRNAGIGPGERIALAVQNVPDFVLTTLAAWRIGAAIMPVNPMYRSRELALLFGDATPAAIVCHADQLADVKAAMAAAGSDALLLSSSPHAFAARADDRVLPPRSEVAGVETLDGIYRAAGKLPTDTAAAPVVDGERLALLLYTSGTTGTPKGVRLTHDNLLTSALGAADWFDWRDGIRVLAMAPLFHITGFVLHMAASIVSRGSLVLAYRFHPEVVLEAMIRHRPTFSIAPITAFLSLSNTPSASADHFTSFDHLCTGGAPAPPAVVAGFRDRFGVTLINGYGMTELGGGSHFAPPGRAAPIDPESGALSIGIPVFGVEADIVDDAGRAVAPGEIGELTIRGRQVMEGYWQRPDASAEALHDGWLRTGDVAKMNDEGWFFLIDRKRDMIIASGFKVWPREVEDVLYAHPAVLEAAVVGVADAYRGETVKAVVTLRPGAHAQPDDLVSHCRANLAAYKVPRICEIIDQMPKTLTGKIVRADIRRAAQHDPAATEISGKPS